MKGIVFTEFLEMVENKFDYDTVDKIINNSNLESKGIYTSIGTYDHNEMVQLVGNLSKETEIPVSKLLNTYGQYLFNTFHKGYPEFFSRSADAFSFLESIEEHIHVEVKKLYPDAQLPTFETERIGDNVFEMVYKSKRAMSDFAEGLIEKTLVYYQTEADIQKEAVEADGSVVKFTITKND